jgi:sulfur carrier protein ThiS
MTKFYWNGVEIVSSQKRKRLAVESAKDFCEKHKISYTEIIIRQKTYETVHKRVKVARYLKSLGFGLEPIAYALNRDRMCIKNYLDEDRFKLTEPAIGHASQNNL